MENISNIPTNSDKQHDDSRLHDAIEAYISFLGNQKQEADMGKTLLGLGTKTKMASEIEKFVFNPIQSLLDTKKNIDNSVVKLVDQFVSVFITKNKEQDIIDSAFKRIDPSNGLYYGITLHEDTFENRDKVLNFLVFYNSLEFSQQIPVYFQFVPSNLKSAFSEVTNIA